MKGVIGLYTLEFLPLNNANARGSLCNWNTRGYIYFNGGLLEVAEEETIDIWSTSLNIGRDGSASTDRNQALALQWRPEIVRGV